MYFDLYATSWLFSNYPFTEVLFTKSEVRYSTSPQMSIITIFSYFSVQLFVHFHGKWNIRLLLDPLV